MTPSTRNYLKLGVLGAFALFLLIQLVPYGRAHTNPPVTQAAAWGPGPGEQIAMQSCGDCHSNLTKWRWYSNIAPMSWLIQNDVDGGRSKLNFSEWDKPQPELSDIVDQVSGGGMPPLQYTLPHPSAKLSDTEKQQLINALDRLYAKDPPPSG